MKKIVFLMSLVVLPSPFGIIAHEPGVPAFGRAPWLTTLTQCTSDFAKTHKGLIAGLTAMGLTAAYCAQSQEDDLNSVAIPADDDVRMRPIKINGHYYYSKDDTYKHIDLSKALSIVLSPTMWIKKITALFYPAPAAEHASDANATLQPAQMIPCQESIKPKIIWIGHATFLIQINGFNIVTDPIFGDVKVGPLSLTKRAMAPGIQLEDLPPIDIVVISHNHSDHTDTHALMILARTYDPIVYVPEGNRALFESMGFTRVIENTWWDQEQLTKNGYNVSISCLPAYHWSIRFSLGSYRCSLWSSWMISTDTHNIFFAGDTAYGKHFKQIGAHFPSIDVALMPIGPTEEGENRHKCCHVDAPEAVQAFEDLGARYFVPMHFGTFFLSKSTLEHPIRRMRETWQQKGLPHDRLLFMQCGKEYTIA